MNINLQIGAILLFGLTETLCVFGVSWTLVRILGFCSWALTGFIFVVGKR